MTTNFIHDLLQQVYCGHEYALKNLAYAAHVEPKNQHVHDKIKWAEERRQESEPTVPSTIGKFKLYNTY